VADYLPKGDKRADWKGGRYQRKEGYIYVRIYDTSPYFSMVKKRPNAHSGYVLEHRLVMAQHLGRPLEPWEIVHHRPPGIKDDNRIENLKLLLSNSEHSKMFYEELQSLRTRITALESRNTVLEAEIALLKAQLEKDGVQDYDK